MTRIDGAGTLSLLTAPDPPPDPGARPRTAPQHLADLHLDRLLESLVRDRDHHGLDEILAAPLRRVADVDHRLDVFDDLGNEAIATGLRDFSDAIGSTRRLVAAAEAEESSHVAEGLLLEAIDRYGRAIPALVEVLQREPVQSAGLVALRDLARRHAGSAAFQLLCRRNRELGRRLQEVEYAVRIRGLKVTVTPGRSRADYSEDVLATFERFRQHDATSHLARYRDVGVGRVEATILDLVAQLHRELFSEVAAHLDHARGFLDPAFERVHHELQFFFAWRSVMDEARTRGVRFCRPRVREETAAGEPWLRIDGGSDLGLVLTGAAAIVPNDLLLNGRQRTAIISGPNQGGKTTFLRMVGGICYLASLGCPVPARSALLRMPTEVFTHFERTEDRERDNPGGALEDDLLRIREILHAVTDRSVVVINEMFSSTSLADAAQLGDLILRQLEHRGATTLWVTFVEDLARRGPGTLSLVGRTRPDDPTAPTFEIVPAPPSGRVHATALAARYGLRGADVIARIPAGGAYADPGSAG